MTTKRPSPEHKPRIRITAEARPIEDSNSSSPQTTLAIGRTVWLGTRSYVITAFTRKNNVDMVTMVSMDNTRFEVVLPRRILEEV